MPKVRNTRKQRARNLLKLLTNGPAFSELGIEAFTPKTASADFRMWSNSWIIPELLELVPELRAETKAEGR